MFHTKRSVSRAFTLVELMVVTAVLVLLLLLLLPTIPAREHGGRPSCLSHEKQIGLALLMYLQDYDERLPPPSTREVSFPFLLDPYVKNGALWQCPQDPVEEHAFNRTASDQSISYGYNWLGLTRDGKGIPLKEIEDTEHTVALAESISDRTSPNDLLWLGGTPLDYRHLHDVRGMNVTWLDGHAKWMQSMVLEMEHEWPGSVSGSAVRTYPSWNIRLRYQLNGD